MSAREERLRLAWQSARERAQAYSEGNLQRIEDRDTWMGWAKEAQAEVQRLQAERHSTNEALSDAAVQLRVQRDRIAELEALELGDVDDRVSAACGNAKHPTWLRQKDDTRACPWCVIDMQSKTITSFRRDLEVYQAWDRKCQANQRSDKSLAAVANLRIAELSAERDRLKDRVAELEAYAYGCDAEGCVQPHSSWCDVAQKSAATNNGCTCGESLPHAMHCWKVNPPRNEVEEMRRALAARPARQPEDPHDGPLHHDYAVPRDLPTIPAQTTGRCPQGHTFEDCTCGGTPR